MKNLLTRPINIVLLLSIFLALSGIAYATECWLYDNDQTQCEANDCQWNSDPWGSWCQEKNCWNIWSEGACNAADNANSTYFINQTCSWFSGTTSWCQDADCWLFSGTNESYCESGNPYGLSCNWEERCVSTRPGADCWEYDTNQSGCTATEGCTWGDCYTKSCWSGTTSSECAQLTGYNGQSCSWNSADSYCYEQGCWDYSNSTDCTANSCIWENGYCSEPWCDDWSYTNQDTCENNTAGLSCTWDAGMQRCDMKGCWNYQDQASCAAVNQSGTACVWNTDDTAWCEMVECWTFDNITVTNLGGVSTNETYCVNNSAGLNCIYDANGGWCYKNASTDMSCSAITTERDCMDTFYCWWDFGASTCNDPEWGGEGFSDDQFFTEWNPGCYIFDGNQTACENVIGCTWDGTGCNGNENSGMNCTLINDSSMCNSIPALSTCCNWQGNSCVANWADHSCWDQMDEPPEGAMYCEDYKAYESEILCTQIAGNPWFMPCKWNNNTGHCEFNAADVFGGENNAGFEMIDNKMNCEAANGKWITLSYCEGNRSVSVGTCEHKFDEDRNCDKVCYACEYKTDGTNHATLGDAKAKCEGSRGGLPPNSPDGLTGWCEFTAYSSQASDGRWGECSQKDDSKATGGKKCSSSDCGACTFLGKVSDGTSKNVCETAGCKWFEDPLDDNNGWCGAKGEKSCTESCEKCYDGTSCRETGGGGNGACSWDDSTLVCMPSSGSGNMEVCWDGVDNDGNGNTDCGDSKCFTDPFCGGGTMMDDFGIDCFAYDDDATACADAGCYFVNESWGSWCDMPGMQCFAKDGTNETYCEDDSTNNDTCEWHSDGGGHCGFQPTMGCFGLTNETQCNATSDCAWVTDDWCDEGGGWCDPDPDWNGAWYDCVQHDFDGEATCESHQECNWYVDPWCQQQGDNAGFCDFVGFTCMEYENSTACSDVSYCSWHSDPYSPQGGWCDMGCFNPNLNQQACEAINITATTSCQWMGGFCDPKGFGGAMGGGGAGGFDCFKFDGNETGCNNQTGCGFFSEMNPFCDIDFSGNCPQYSYNETVCNQQSKCKYNPQMNFCDEKPFECHWNSTLQSNSTACDANDLCLWVDDQWGTRCEPICFNQAAQTAGNCVAAGGGGLCSWKTGWCDPAMGAQMFNEMEKGAPIMLGNDDCGPGTGLAAEADICGFGLKDMGDAWGFGTGVYDLSNAALCNGVYMQQGSGSGTNATKFFWYLDTDGTDTGGCAAKDNGIAGFEFYFKYEASINNQTGAVDETFAAYKCVNSEWGVADIKLSSKKQFMCQEIQGGMIAVDKNDLNKYPALFVPGNDFRVYVATADASGTVTSPTDTAGPNYGSPHAIDFKMECCWDPGADCDGDGLTSQNDPECEDINKKGYIEYEECLNGIDDDHNGLTDCYDPACRCEESDCSDIPKCANTGVNSPTYIDNTAPELKAVMMEEYHDSALVMYYTDEPANGTLTFYNQSAICDSTAPGVIVVNDSGLVYTNVRDYKLWHDAELYNANLGYSLLANTSYYYKLKVCDQDGNCGTSACTNFTTAVSAAECHFCDFVTQLKAPTGWNVSYDIDRDGIVDHMQGQVCGAKAGMKMNYSSGRSVDVILTKSDNTTWMKFLNARLTRSGLTWKTRDIEDDGITSGTSGNVGYTGLPAATRDKIVNNLYPEICQVKIAGTSDELWHCDDSLSNCYEIENADTNYLNESGADYRIWNVPYCEFSVWSGEDASDDGNGGDTSTGGGGGGGSGTDSSDLEVQVAGSTSTAATVSKNQKINFVLGSVAYPYRVDSVTGSVIKLKDLITFEMIYLFLGSSKRLDLDSDGKDDISLMLSSVSGGKATVAFTPLADSGSIIKDLPPPAPRTKRTEETPASQPAAAPAATPPQQEAPSAPQPEAQAQGNQITGSSILGTLSGNGAALLGFGILVLLAGAAIILAFRHGHKKGATKADAKEPEKKE